MIPRRLLLELVGAALLVCGLLYWHHSAIVKGRDEIRAEDAKALAQQQAKNDAESARLTQLNRDISHDYEAQLDTSRHDNDTLRNQLRSSRVCLNSPSSRPVSAPATTPARTPSAPSGDELQRTIADDLVDVAAACQANTDTLVSLQRWIADALQATRAQFDSEAAHQDWKVPLNGRRPVLKTGVM